MSNEPLWQNDRWGIFPDYLGMYHRGKVVMRAMREQGFQEPERTYYEIADFSGCEPDLLYDAFLQLATYWDLQCNYDELRKIRDEMKEKAS